MSRQLLYARRDVEKYQYWHDDGDGGFAIESVQDVEPILDHVRMMRDVADPRAEMRLVAEIPSVFIDQAIREGWWHDEVRMRRFLNDSEYRAFRVWGGAL